MIWHLCRTCDKPRAWFGRIDFIPPLFGWWCVACLPAACLPEALRPKAGP